MAERKNPASKVTAANSNTRLTTGPSPRRGVSRADAGMPRPANSNTRVGAGLAVRAPRRDPGAGGGAVPRGEATSEAALAGLRGRMAALLAQQGIRDDEVLRVMAEVPRHRFIDEALASRAYENAALPIGAGQTISQPWIVARMLAVAREGGALHRVLEVGTGCGYQAALLARLADQVVSLERIRSLHEQAVERLRTLGVRNAKLVLGDGNAGWPAGGPYDAILVAAAGLHIPPALLGQLAVGGRLLAPEGGSQQRLVLIERSSRERFRRTELEFVRFVPLQTGVQL